MRNRHITQNPSSFALNSCSQSAEEGDIAKNTRAEKGTPLSRWSTQDDPETGLSDIQGKHGCYNRPVAPLSILPPSRWFSRSPFPGRTWTPSDSTV